jgi:hypothetical protein
MTDALDMFGLQKTPNLLSLLLEAQAVTTLHVPVCYSAEHHVGTQN